MADLLNSVDKILKDLNGGKTDGDWFVVPSPEYFYLGRASLEKGSIKPTNETLVALKAFVNSKTGEMKIYVAKWIDKNAADLLP